MNQSTEIEFKTALTKSQFDQLCEKYAPLKRIWQINFYYDTCDFQLKKHHCGLRIRQFEDGSAEATLKTPQEIGLLETTESFSKTQMDKMKWRSHFPLVPAIQAQLDKYNIDCTQLVLFAELTTTRFEKELSADCAIMIDQSSYYGTTDYELEMEVRNHLQGQKDYRAFLADNHLKDCPMNNKIARALEQKERVQSDE